MRLHLLKCICYHIYSINWLSVFFKEHLQTSRMEFFQDTEIVAIFISWLKSGWCAKKTILSSYLSYYNRIFWVFCTCVRSVTTKECPKTRLMMRQILSLCTIESVIGVSICNLPFRHHGRTFCKLSLQRDSTDNVIMSWPLSKSVLPSQEASMEKCSRETRVASQLTGM